MKTIINQISSRKKYFRGLFQLFHIPFHSGKTIKDTPLEGKTGRKEMNMTSGPLLMNMIRFTIPIIFSGLLQLLFNAADVVVVGRFAGDNALAAVGGSGSMIQMIIGLFLGLSVGANAVAARLYGAKRFGELNKAMHTAMFLSIYVGVLISIVGIIFCRQILELMNTPGAILELSTRYMRIFFMGSLAGMVYNYGSAVLRGMGDSKRPFYYLMFSGIVNVLLNLLFVICFKMSVGGVALATIISQYMSAFLIIQCLRQRNGKIKLEWRKLKFDLPCLKEILWIGLPSGLGGTVFAVTNVIMQSSINTFGEILVAGNSVAINLEGFIYVSMNAFAHTALTFSGQNAGVKNMARIRRVFKLSFILTTIMGVLLGGLGVIFRYELIGLYTSSPEVTRYAALRILYFFTTYYMCGWLDPPCFTMRGLGYVLLPTILILVCVCGLRLVCIWVVFPIERFHNIHTIYISYPVSWLLTSSGLYMLYRHATRKIEKKWKMEAA